MQKVLDEVTPEQQSRAARLNNRDYIYKQISDYLAPNKNNLSEAFQERVRVARQRPDVPSDDDVELIQRAWLD